MGPFRALVNDSMSKVLPIAMKERRSDGEELSVTTLVSGNIERLSGIGNVDDDDGRVCQALDVYVYVGGYVVPAFGVRGNGARLAVVGRGRDVANAKYSDWVRSVCMFLLRERKEIYVILLKQKIRHFYLFLFSWQA